MDEQISRALLQLKRRADQVDRKTLQANFVAAGTLVPLLSSTDHQIIYGRRGTGKTHALLYHAETRANHGDHAVYIDLRTTGSTGGLYSDAGVPIPERGTRLLVDTLSAVHDALLNIAIEGQEADLSRAGAALDLLAQAITTTALTGEMTEEFSTSREARESVRGRAGLGASVGSIAIGASHEDATSAAAATQHRMSLTGRLRHRIHFGGLSDALRQVYQALGGRRIWILIDEWSVIPTELQPYLADLIRRAIFPATGFSVKIAAIEQRSSFQIPGDRADYVGIEVGADAAADLNLDDFMVFENSADRSTNFFRDLLYSHYSSAAAELGQTITVAMPELLVQAVFTQRNTFNELVTAAEGVPRDAINILILATQRAGTNQISIANIRDAARAWYQRDKDAAISANASARRLLDWIVREVIGERRARAFLLRSGTRHKLIDDLFDARVLHLIKRSISAHDQPGVRYDVYKIDYGCYVDLLTTQSAPRGLLPADDTGRFIDVPPDDYRAIRRAILDLSRFAPAQVPDASSRD